MKLSTICLGNCHNSGIIYFLNKSEEFKNTFNIKQYANWQLIKNNCEIPFEDIKNADLFIYQPLADVYGCYSTNPTIENSIITFVKSNCIKISYPYTYNSALWPICQAGRRQNRWFGWQSIYKLILAGLDHHDIIHLYDENKIDFEYKNRFIETMEILEKKELKTDIKISKYIKENIQKKLLFTIPQHPTDFVFFMISNQILKILNMKLLSEECVVNDNDVDLEDSTYWRPDKMFPIHQSAIDYYNLSFGSKYIKDSHEFYKNRILDYLYMNPNNNLPENYNLSEEE